MHREHAYLKGIVQSSNSIPNQRQLRLVFVVLPSRCLSHHRKDITSSLDQVFLVEQVHLADAAILIAIEVFEAISQHNCSSQCV